MRLIAAFLQMIRLPNLLFIALTQVLFQLAIFRPLYGDAVPANDWLSFVLLVFASLFIAAAGYIINDYFDINIDEINKPSRMVVDRVISRRWAIAWHFMLSTTGILLTALALPLREKWYLVLANIGCVLLLWFYSTTLKRKLLIGNILISALTAWTILIIFFSKVQLQDAVSPSFAAQPKFFRFAFLYAGFAFIISLVREAIKDMEDMQGDARYGCRTMPIVWGVTTTKAYSAIWLLVLGVVLVTVQVYILQFQWWAAVAYCIFLIILPLILLFVRLLRATTVADFARLSRLTKWIMLTGILSMAFFYFYL
ncbi:MAG: geranylgeranylglycerol-phosphate geranylgeranyltransferase [Chitinophagaceae bacterium]